MAERSVTGSAAAWLSPSLAAGSLQHGHEPELRRQGLPLMGGIPLGVWAPLLWGCLTVPWRAEAPPLLGAAVLLVVLEVPVT